MTEEEFKRLWFGDFKPETPQHKEVLNSKTFEGIYQNKCLSCGCQFFGYKYRVICKACEMERAK